MSFQAYDSCPRLLMVVDIFTADLLSYGQTCIAQSQYTLFTKCKKKHHNAARQSK